MLTPRSLSIAALLLLALMGCTPGAQSPSQASASPSPSPSVEPSVAPLQGGIQ